MSRKEIDAEVEVTLNRFYGSAEGTKALAKKAAGVLVFPSVIKAGIVGIGGQYGEGSLLVNGEPDSYYNLVSASIGFQLGVQAYSTIIMFLTPEALTSFTESDGWKVGVDASVAVITLGMGAKLDTDNIKGDVVAFVFDHAGIMYSLSLEGTKISRISG